MSNEEPEVIELGENLKKPKNGLTNLTNQKTTPVVSAKLIIKPEEKNEKRLLSTKNLTEKLNKRIETLSNIKLCLADIQNLTDKIESEVFKITSSGKSLLNYEDYMSKIQENLSVNFDDACIYKIFRGKIGLQSDLYKKFVDLNYKPILNKNVSTICKAPEKPKNIYKCYFCKVEIHGTNFTYQQHLVSKHMKIAEIKLERLTAKTSNTFSTNKNGKSAPELRRRSHRTKKSVK